MERIVVISGGTSGIGKASANNFLNNQDKVIVLGRNAQLENDMHYVCDVTNEEMVKKCMFDINKRFGRIDLLINSAGMGQSGITELIPTQSAKDIFEVNYFGTLNTIKHALPYMVKGAKIINLGSAMALFPLPYRVHYASVKAAVVTLSYALRLELMPLGIGVTCVSPGDVLTNFTKNREKNFETNERYGKAMEQATKRLDARQDKRMPVEKVADAIFKISNKDSMRPHYIIGGKYKLLHFASRFVSKNTLLSGINKYVNK